MCVSTLAYLRPGILVITNLTVTGVGAGEGAPSVVHNFVWFEFITNMCNLQL